jgi:hypothetical protein
MELAGVRSVLCEDNASRFGVRPESGRETQTVKRESRTFYAPCAALCLALAIAQGAQARQAGQESVAAAAVHFVAEQEPQVAQIAEPSRRLYLLQSLAGAALAAGDKAKAASLARDLMALGDELKSRPGFGADLYSDAMHVGNLVLGHLALEAGDVGQAKEHLLAAGRVPGSPALKSFGPHMLLAKQLIEKGEREAAVQYFDLCAMFWALERGRLAKWKEEVKRGGMPDWNEPPDYGLSVRKDLAPWRHWR